MFILEKGLGFEKRERSKENESCAMAKNMRKNAPEMGFE